jgi:hypothetical protein
MQRNMIKTRRPRIAPRRGGTYEGMPLFLLGSVVMMEPEAVGRDVVETEA